MKTKIMVFLVSVSFFLSAATGFAGGSGTSSDPYQISTCQELQDMENDDQAHYILVNDIDCSDTETWNSGRGFRPIENFGGSLEGQGYTVSSLYIDRQDQEIGLFGGLESGGEVKNIVLENVDITGEESVGSILGTSQGGIISDVSVTGTVSGEKSGIGGLTGVSEDSTDIYLSDFEGKVSGEENVGGLVGSSNGESSINQSYSAGTVSGSNQNIGGLIGSNNDGTAVVNQSYSTSDVFGYSSTGGLVGYLEGAVSQSFSTGNVSGNDGVGGLIGSATGESVISNTYSLGNVSGSVYTAGLVGSNRGDISTSYSSGNVEGNGGLVASNDGTVSESYWDTERSGKSSSDGGTGLTTSEMIGASASSNMGGFNFNLIWETVEASDPSFDFDGYPILRQLDSQKQISLQPFNSPPESPSNPSPSDGASDISTSTTLSVKVSDEDDDSLDVTFYNASDDSEIGVDTDVASGERASVDWNGLEPKTSYSWYAVANDGASDTQSPEWSFQTEDGGTGGGLLKADRVNINLDNRYSSVIVEKGVEKTVFFDVENRDSNLKTVRTYLEGLDAEYADGTTVKTYNIDPKSSERFQVRINGSDAGKKLLRIKTENLNLKVNTTLEVPVFVRNYPTSNTVEVSGIGTVQILLLLLSVSTLYYLRL